MNTLRKILEAMNAAIHRDRNRAIGACLDRNLTDLGRERFPIGPSVQIAVGNHRVGTFRAIARPDGNLLIERRNKIPQRPKCKTRMANMGNRDEMDHAPTPPNARIWAKRRRWSAGEYPDAPQLHIPDLTGAKMKAMATIGIRDSPPPEGDLVEIGQQVLDSPEQGGDPMVIGVVFG